tara:strand:+ start:574 stop:1194 length:621 start_codon:yes stop_codon:yes gene_type:complete
MAGDGDSFYPVVILPEEYWVFDFTRGPNSDWNCPFEYQIGRYDEHRPNMYTNELFSGDRELHVGIDIGAPLGTEIHAFSDGVVHSVGINSEDGSYGPTIITEHLIKLPIAVGSNELLPVRKVWALHGHLSTESLDSVHQGMSINKGEVFARIGGEDENGGWPPHLHFQLSYTEPQNNDLPGVVTLSDRDEALAIYPDPRLVLGHLY